MSQKDVFATVKALTGQANILTIPRVFIDITDTDLPAALLLGQIVYWTDKTKSPGGWIYKSYREWQDEIGLTPFQTKRAAGALKKKELIETKIKRANSAPTIHYRLIAANLTIAIMKFIDNRETSQSDYKETSQSDYQVSSQSLTETTIDLSETTRGFPDSLNTPQFTTAWQEWKKYRAEMKKKVTPSTEKKQLKKLAGYTVETAIAMIEQSIEKGWQGLFDVKAGQVAQTDKRDMMDFLGL